MATQTTLTWGSLQLSVPSNGHDGYRVKHNPGVLDVHEQGIDGAAGRLIIVLGQGQSENTARRLVIEGEHSEASESTLHTWLESVMAATQGTVNAVRTVTYGVLNAGNSHTLPDCRMQFEQSGDFAVAGGRWFCPFTATFTKVGA